MVRINKKFWFTVFTLIGTIVGAGILGLPYVFSKSGFFIGVFWLLFLGILLLYVKLCMGEITLRTKGFHQLPGYAQIYTGKKGKLIMLFAMIFGIYSALIAYLVGGGQNLSNFFIGNLNYSIFFAIISWATMTYFLKKGIEGLKKIETYGMLTVIFIVIGLFLWFIPQLSFSNLKTIQINNFFTPFSVTLFALLGFSCIPALRKEIKGEEKLLKKAIITGVFISIFLYIVFSFIFVGVFGSKISEVATVSSGRVISLLGAFTILTSYFVLSFVLKDIFILDLKKSKFISFIFVSIIPLCLYLIISYFELFDFASILGIGGIISGGLTGIMILIMSMNAKKTSKLKPEYEMPLNWIIVFVLSLIFVVGSVFAFLEIFK